MVTKVLMPSSSITTDCLEVARTIHKGQEWATSPRRLLARLYNLVMPAFDTEQDRQLVTWMPSHLTGNSVEGRLKLNGESVSHVDLKANRRADVLAKRGAATHRVSNDVRQQLDELERATIWVARAIGYATWAANHRDEKPCRDAEPDDGWKRTRQRQQRRRPRPTPREARPVALGGHRLERMSEGWRCALCRRKSKHWARIANGICEGAAAHRWAARARDLASAVGHLAHGGTDGVGHVRFMTDATTWCDRCGAYADTFAVGLANICPGRPQSAGKEQHLRRLRRGRHPVTNLPFHGTPIPEPHKEAQKKPTPPPPAHRESWGSGAAAAPGPDAAATSGASGSALVPACSRIGQEESVMSGPSASSRLAALRERVKEKALRTMITRRITGKTSQAELSARFSSGKDRDRLPASASSGGVGTPGITRRIPREHDRPPVPQRVSEPLSQDSATRPLLLANLRSRNSPESAQFPSRQRAASECLVDHSSETQAGSSHRREADDYADGSRVAERSASHHDEPQFIRSGEATCAVPWRPERSVIRGLSIQPRASSSTARQQLLLALRGSSAQSVPRPAPADQSHLSPRPQAVVAWATDVEEHHDQRRLDRRTDLTRTVLNKSTAPVCHTLSSEGLDDAPCAHLCDQAPVEESPRATALHTWNLP